MLRLLLTRSAAAGVRLSSITRHLGGSRQHRRQPLAVRPLSRGAAMGKGAGEEQAALDAAK